MAGECRVAKHLNMKQISRRSFFSVTTGAGIATTAGCVAVNLKQGYIDAHVHVWTPDTSKYPLAQGLTKKSGVDSFTPEQLFVHCRPEGVARVVLIQMSFYQFDNRYMLDAIAKYPDVFKGVAMVNEHEAGVMRSMKDLARQGIRGFRLMVGKENDPEKWLGSAGMSEIWRTAADEGLSICTLVNPEMLPFIGKMCVKYPRTNLIIDHFGRIGITGTIQRADLDCLLSLSKYPQVYVKTSAFYALGRKQAPYLDLGPMIRDCRDNFGAQRLMWASDAPFQVDQGHNYHDSVSLIRDRLDFLSAEDRDWMLRRTAEKLYWI